MIPRYTPSEFAILWSDETRFGTWLDIELAACEAMESEGLVPIGTAKSIRNLNLVLDPQRIHEIEKTTRHDVIAFLTHVEQLAGAPARYLHRGMTSSDVLDTGFAILLTRATDALLLRLESLLEVLKRRSKEHSHTVLMGRSHGIHAEPVTFGVVLAGHYCELKRGLARLMVSREEIRTGKLAGAVGTYAHLSPAIERKALESLGLKAETVPTQVVARDRHAALFGAMALIAAGIERLATNVRHWQRTEVSEAEELFSTGQKGSSAMPHKRNPILSENLCGLSRIVRAAVTPALENIVLWHERDISHSSVERMIAPDVTTTLAFMLDRATQLIEGLVVYPEQMNRNVQRSAGLCFSESVLLALVDRGIARQQAYVMVQRNAMKAIEGHGSLLENLLSDEQVVERIGREPLIRCFDLEHSLRHVDEILARAFE